MGITVVCSTISMNGAGVRDDTQWASALVLTKSGDDVAVVNAITCIDTIASCRRR